MFYDNAQPEYKEQRDITEGQGGTRESSANRHKGNSDSPEAAR
jgi:hypothetical protein